MKLTPLRRVGVFFTGLSRSQLMIGFVVVLAVLLLVAQPIKQRTYTSVKRLGDDALARREFGLAKTEYQKLRLIAPRSAEPEALINRARVAEQDILSLRQFYIERGDHGMLALLDRTTADYPTPDVATQACQELLKQAEPELALACIEKTTTTWPRYRDGWITKSIITRVLGRDDATAEALQKAKELDPNSAPTNP